MTREANARQHALPFGMLLIAGASGCAADSLASDAEQLEVAVSAQALDCRSDFDCWFTNTPVCAGNECVECSNDGDCWSGACRNNQCREVQCRSDSDCQGAETCRDGNCILIPPPDPEPPVRAICGDGRLDASEECDPLWTNDYHCDPRTCRVQVAGAEAAFDRCNPRGGGDNCTGNTSCGMVFNTEFCMLNSCESIPATFRQIAVGEGSALPYCFFDCSAAACPNNTSCQTVDFFGVPTPVCLPR